MIKPNSKCILCFKSIQLQSWIDRAYKVEANYHMTEVTSPKRPLLSFVMTGRNDGFMGDFNWRLGTSINIMARAAARLGRLDDLEIIVSDWNSEIPLHKVVELVPEAKKITKFLPVPSEIAVPAQKDTHFPDSIVLNAAIRRASGEFISQTGSDVVFTAAALNALLNVLDGKYAGLPLKKAFLSGGRRHIPNAIVNRRLPLKEFEEYLNRNAAYFTEERGGAGHAAPTNMMLLHRDLWHACRGFDEKFIYWGFNDIDLALRITAQHGFIPLENFGVNSLHMEHWTKPRDYAPEKMFRKLNPVDNLTPEFAPNLANWGLGDFDIPLMPCEGPEPDIIGGVVEETPWYGPLENLGQELTRPEVQNAVRDVLAHFGNLPIPPSEHPALITLVWCLAARKPRSYVEIGFRLPHTVALVARHSPGTELQLVADFERRAEDDRLFYNKPENSLIFYLTNTLRHNGHWSYTHYMQQSQVVDGQQVEAELDFKGPLDLVLVRVQDDRLLASVRQACTQLRKGAAVILTARTPELFQKAQSIVTEQCPGHQIVYFGDGLNGLFLMSI